MRIYRVRYSGEVHWASSDEGTGPEAASLTVWTNAPWYGGARTPRTLARGDCSLLAPVTPTKIVCIGRNYLAHIRELGNEVPAEPTLFLKPPSSLLDPGEDVVLPLQSQRVEYEGELAIVLGASLKNATAANALNAIAGITCANDVTARDLQRKDVQFTRAKGFDSFCPVGPCVATQFGPLDAIALDTRINGERRQASDTSHMIWPVTELLIYVSSVMTLEPGDLLLTGTPEGTGPLAPGDRVEVHIAGVGTLEHGVRASERSSQ